MDLSSPPTARARLSPGHDGLRTLDWAELRARFTAARLSRRAPTESGAARRNDSFDPAAARRLAAADRMKRGR